MGKFAAGSLLATMAFLIGCPREGPRLDLPASAKDPHIRSDPNGRDMANKPLAPGRQAVYDWFDSLGFAGDLRGTFVEIKFASGGGREVLPEYGFLTGSDPSGLTARTIGLEEIKNLAPADPDDRFPIKSTARPIDLKGWLVDQKKRLLADPDSFDARRGYYSGCTDRVDVFLLARIADLRGYSDLADWFYRQVPSVAGSKQELPDDAADLLSKLKNDIAETFFFRAMQSFRNRSISREQLLSQFTFVVDHFPDGEYRSQSQVIATKLQAMLAADRAHKPASKAELAAMPPDERAKELVWQLEDAEAGQGLEPGYTSVFGGINGYVNPKGDACGAPLQLVALGWAAVPALLDALHDTRYIRGKQEGMHVWPREILLVRDAAVQILNQISFQWFSSSPERFKTDAEAEDAFRKASEWWASAKTKTEVEYLVEKVSTGAAGSGEMARRLIGLQPDAALGAIRSGIKRADDQDREGLISSLRELKPSDGAITARDQMFNGKTRTERLVAAEVVLESDPDAAKAAFIRDWPNTYGPDSDPGAYARSEELQQFLSTSGRPQAFQILVAEMRKANAQSTFELLERLYDAFYGLDPKLSPNLRNQCQRFIEDGFAAELTNRDVAIVSGITGDYSFSNPGSATTPRTISPRCGPNGTPSGKPAPGESWT